MFEFLSTKDKGIDFDSSPTCKTASVEIHRIQILLTSVSKIQIKCQPRLLYNSHTAPDICLLIRTYFSNWSSSSNLLRETSSCCSTHDETITFPFRFNMSPKVHGPLSMLTKGLKGLLFLNLLYTSSYQFYHRSIIHKASNDGHQNQVTTSTRSPQRLWSSVMKKIVASI